MNWRSCSASCAADELRQPASRSRRYVKLYTPYQRQVRLWPGITDYASIAYRNENDLLAGTDDPERCTSSRLCPTKSS
ncbi:MAG: hypothetical protein ACLRUN_14660 [Christensenellales bacterium]